MARLRPATPVAARLARLAAATTLLLCARPAPAAELLWRSTDPRPYGHQLGDLVTRDIDIDLPPGATLDPDSLPKPARANRWFDLRAIERSQPGAGREHLRLTWQVTGVRDVASYVDLPALDLRLRTPDGERALYVDGRRIAVAPVAPPDSEPELLDDAPARFVDTRPARLQTLAAASLLLLIATGWLFRRHVWPLLRPSRRPFALALRELRHQQRKGASLAAACATLHAAFNASAGRVLLADGLADFLREQPAYAPAAGPIAAFYAESQLLLFAGRAPDDPVATRAALLALARRLRDLERAA
ncbi:hypothetical protein [Derxia gummosa]|uniref:MxaA protein n=1 Tax=Derxia gummosa DSM 723 TaxID=1121388 RepID=A0A8B6X387_9BURK|nr:hypothetical protein [Derxia gummosa]